MILMFCSVPTQGKPREVNAQLNWQTALHTAVNSGLVIISPGIVISKRNMRLLFPHLGLSIRAKYFKIGRQKDINRMENTPRVPLISRKAPTFEG